MTSRLDVCSGVLCAFSLSPDFTIANRHIHLFSLGIEAKTRKFFLAQFIFYERTHNRVFHYSTKLIRINLVPSTHFATEINTYAKVGTMHAKVYDVKQKFIGKHKMQINFVLNSLSSG